MDEIVTILKELGLPFAYDHFAEGESKDPPFVCFRIPASNNFSADGIPYFESYVFDIELYTDKKDRKIEKKLEKLFKKAGIFYSKTEVWIRTERLYEVVYTFEWGNKDE